MSNLAVLTRGLLAVGVTIALGCSTKAFNTRAIGVASDGGTDTRPAARRGP